MATYYVRPTNGVDGGGNDGLSFANAWKTFQYTIDNVAANDTILLCAEATETTTVTIDIDVVNGSASGPVNIQGRDGTDGTTRATYTIQAVATWGGGALVARANAFGDFFLYSDIVFDGNGLATNCFEDNDTGSSTAGQYVTFTNCRFTGGTSDGYNTNHTGPTYFYYSTFDNNTGDGFASAGNGDGQSNFFHCKFHDNTTYGCYAADNNFQFINCEIYANGDDGVNIGHATGDAFVFLNSNFHNNGASGIYDISGADYTHVVGCSFTDNTTYGIESADTTLDPDAMVVFWYNHFDNNGTAETNYSGGTPGYGKITGAPLFVSETPTAEDFELSSSSSPLHEASPGDRNVGARKTVDGGGGGGGIGAIAGKSGGIAG